MKEDQILQEALEHLQKLTGIAIEVEATGFKDIDKKIQFHLNGKTHHAFIEVKKHTRAHQLVDLNRLKEKFNPLLLVSEYIYPKMKAELRNENIGYLETCGNIYLKDKDLYLWLDGQKKTVNIKEKNGRAFTKTGLKLVFHLLLNEDLINLTYREIAIQTGISFGNINVILNDLKNQGFLLEIKKHIYKLTNKKDLLQRWMVAYEEKLKPALKIGTFRFLRDEDFTHWKKITLQNRKTWWGSEPAADLLTNFLKPGELTLYTKENRQDLMKLYRLIPDENGNVKAYQKFWHEEEADTNMVPPLLVYIDLMNTGDRRCIETAQKIYDRLLQNQF